MSSATAPEAPAPRPPAELQQMLGQAGQYSAERRARGCARPVRLVGSTGLVFTTRHGTPVEPRNLARTFGLLCERSGVRRIRLHDTRHTCASLLAAAGTHPRTIMAILGHSQIGVTMNVYTQVATEDQRAAVGLVGGLLDRAAGAEDTPSRQTQPSDGLDDGSDERPGG